MVGDDVAQQSLEAERVANYPWRLHLRRQASDRRNRMKYLGFGGRPKLPAHGEQSNLEGEARPRNDWIRPSVVTLSDVWILS